MNKEEQEALAKDFTGVLELQTEINHAQGQAIETHRQAIELIFKRLNTLSKKLKGVKK